MIVVGSFSKYNPVGTKRRKTESGTADVSGLCESRQAAESSRESVVVQNKGKEKQNAPSNRVTVPY